MMVKKIDEPGRLVGRADGHQFRSGYVILKPGEDVGQHSTDDGEEMLVLLEGTAVVAAGKEIEEVSAPSAVIIPKNELHNVKNESYSLLRYVYIVAMPGRKQ